MANSPMQRPFRFVCQLPEVIADTARLSAESFGVLIRLRMAYWRDGPIKNDNKVLARVVGMQPAEWARTRSEIEPYFEISDAWTCWITQRDLEESYKAIAANKKRTEAARLGKLKQRQKIASDKARDNLCDRACDNDCDSVSHNDCDNPFDNVLIGSIRNTVRSTPENTHPKPSLAKERMVISGVEIDAFVTAVEATFSEVDHGL